MSGVHSDLAVSASFTDSFLTCCCVCRQDYPHTCAVIKFLVCNTLLTEPDAAGCLPVEQIPAVQREEVERCITAEMKVDGNLCKQGERVCASET